MAAQRSQVASSSMSPCTYDVFLSFRGEDTRTNFTDHLYSALVQAGIHTFRDDDEIKRGENIQSELQKAIQESKISTIVFSKDYASSRWCLDELVMIMECRKTNGHIVLPVFYDVNPSQVRKQTGSFAISFARHKKRFRNDNDRVERWRAALKEVADLGGMVLENRYQSQFIQDIVKEIGNKLNRPMLHVAPYLVGRDSLVADISQWLQNGSNDVGVATIYGIPGVGKTTIAKTVYNQNFERFNGSSFLANVRETAKEGNRGLLRLQKQLISDILKGTTNSLPNNIDEGAIKIQKIVCCRRVLIVFDDVDQLAQLNAIIAIRDWLGRGSKIIITTRLERLLTAQEVCMKFRVNELNVKESLQLFSWHAFGKANPPEDYMEHSKRVVHYSGGLPLALQLFGSSLSGESIEFWEGTLEKLETIPDSRVQEILKISYDSLQDDNDKNVFLEIACFFIGMDKDYATTILAGCDYKTVAIHNLIHRYLIRVDEKNKLMMHQLLRDMGREIVRQESPEDLGKRSRVWNHKDAFTILRENAGTETVKGLYLNLPMLLESMRSRTTPNKSCASRQCHDNSIGMQGNFSKRRRLSFFSWKPGYTVPTNSIPLQDEVNLTTEAFAEMHKLKILHLNQVKLSGGYENFPRRLVWLCWQGFPLTSIPTTFCLEKLVVLEMRNSSLKHVWQGTRFLVELKILNLNHSHGLVRTPDFCGLPSLERLLLKDCINLVEVHESIGSLKRLVSLNLKNCKSLKKLPKEISALKFLQELILSGCLNLDEMPEDLEQMESLRVLLANGTAINRSASVCTDVDRQNLLSFKSWPSIFWSWLSPRKCPRSSFFSLALFPHSLVSLSLADCNISGEAFPVDLRNLASLEYLDLSENSFHGLPEGIKSLTKLKALTLYSCTGLQSLPELPISLSLLNAEECTSLERIANLPNFLRLLDLDLLNCNELVEVQSLFKLEPIRNVDLEMLKSFGLFNLDSLGSIEVEMVNAMANTYRNVPLQVLHEFGISSIFLPGVKLTCCDQGQFSFLSAGSSLYFTVPPLPGHKVHGLNLCVVYAFDDTDEVHLQSPFAKISNETNSLKWTYSPTFYANPELNKDMLWLSHWKFGDKLKGGDRVNVSVVISSGYQIKECGIYLFYKVEEDGVQSNNEGTFPWNQTLSDVNISAYQVAPSAYFLCHHDFLAHQEISEIGWEKCGYHHLFEE